MSVLDLLRPDLAGFVPYASARRVGADAPVRLDANELPWPDGVDGPLPNRYPEPQPRELRSALADLYGVGTENVWIGRGSDEAIDLLMRAFCRAGRDAVISIEPTFGMYRTAATLQGARYRAVKLLPEDDFQLDVDALLAQVDADTRLVILCSPNNPTGTLHHACIDTLASALQGRALLVIDEAYIEFADTPSAAIWLDRHENLAVLRTLSKAHGLAGARIGALLGSAALVRFIGSIAAPYPLPAPSISAALAVLTPAARTLAGQRIAMLRAERERVSDALSTLPVIDKVWRSSGNFVLFRGRDAGNLFHLALENGVLLRDVSAQSGLGGCLRMSMGRPDENDLVLQAFSQGCRA